MSGHTKEPWVVDREVNRLTGGEDDPNHGTPLAGTHPAVQGMRCPDAQYNRAPAECEANAARAVTCVNAMAGVQNPHALRLAILAASRAVEEDRADGFDELENILHAAGLWDAAKEEPS